MESGFLVLGSQPGLCKFKGKYLSSMKPFERDFFLRVFDILRTKCSRFEADRRAFRQTLLLRAAIVGAPWRLAYWPSGKAMERVWHVGAPELQTLLYRPALQETSPVAFERKAASVAAHCEIADLEKGGDLEKVAERMAEEMALDLFRKVQGNRRWRWWLDGIGNS